MKFLQKIRAFFNIKGEAKEMELKSAEVKKDGVFLHPIDDENHIFFVKSKSVDIFINPDEEILEDDISIIDKKEIEKDRIELELEEVAPEQSETLPLNNHPLEAVTPNYQSQKKRFSVLLYTDEYDMLIENIKKNGYKRAEYFMACVTSAKKQSFFSTYKKYTLDHDKRHKTEREEAQRAKNESTNSVQ